MKTAQEIKELLEQVKLDGHLRRTPTDYVILDVLLNLNERLAAVEYFVGNRLPSLDSDLKALQLFAERLHALA